MRQKEQSGSFYQQGIHPEIDEIQKRKNRGKRTETNIGNV